MRPYDFEELTATYEMRTYELWVLSQIPWHDPKTTDRRIRLIYRLENLWQIINKELIMSYHPVTWHTDAEADGAEGRLKP